MGARREQFRWGDADEEDEGGLEGVLPPPQVVGPDERGMKRVVEWRLQEDGQRVRRTTTLRVRRALARLHPRAARRRHLSKFGDAAGQLSSDNSTMVSTEEIFLERTNKTTGKTEEAPKSADLGAINPNASLIVCRICGKKGDHWTSKCPFKDLAASRGMAIGEKAPDDDAPGGSLSTAAASGKASYVPPSMRAGAGARMEGESMRQKGRDDNSIRVTNLSEDTREQDLQELFGPFGPISRIYVAFDRETGASRGFAFINFVNREDAVRAINKLDKYGYDNLILRVEWATPRADRA